MFLSMLYLLYELVTEFGFATELYVAENLWTILFKHRIASYVMGSTSLSMTYVMFSSTRFSECYIPVLKQLSPRLHQKIIEITSSRRTNN